ncbi:methionine-synthesizing 5- methyltetrahydropteroyltriglutamate--homocysteine methyltransferase [Blastocladiella emersonii ATCC 22665]|nr:methionine-synthesizing 5- methyltetrahydropteroyltriglutamate--homocysteine methyltransferase [Blastocladiella emersonii ATCC 22665]
MVTTVKSANLGFPRIGAQRELKKLVESYWAGKTSGAALAAGTADLRAKHWQLQKAAGIDLIPSNDFALYDQVLDVIALFDAVPAIYRSIADPVDRYFAMGRGLQDPARGVDVPAMEMKKWFDTNYHYIVPRLGVDTEFRLPADAAAIKPLAEFLEAKALGIQTRPVLLGPISFLLLSRPATTGFSPITLLPKLLRAYTDLLRQLQDAGATDVQLDEPALVLDLPATIHADLETAYAAIAAAAPQLKVTLATYFGGIEHQIAAIAKLPVHAVHVDLVRAPAQLAAVAEALAPTTKVLSLGLVNGRNVWRTDLHHALTLARHAVAVFGNKLDRLVVAPSCSLLHSPVALAQETKLDDDLRSWLAFATEKLDEVRVLQRALAEGPAAVAAELDANQRAIEARRTSARIHNPAVKARVAALTEADFRRPAPFADRWAAQQARLGLPRFTTHTVGSFPQTAEVRKVRAQFKRGAISEAAYWDFIFAETERCIRIQEEIGLDIISHGEFERNDMVEAFGELLAGYAFTQHGWVQSYGSRCVKPPIIYGDVHRPTAMTVDVITKAQAMTAKPLKGMLTGPITMLQWSFVRDDQPRQVTAYQLALAIRDEVVDLEQAGIKVIQIDEPAIREGLPLRHADWAAYLTWSVDAFKLSTSGVVNDTQIHSHMCYSDFNDIFEAIVRMDVDVLSVESSKSDLKLLAAFSTPGAYTNHIGPGVYDIHSPRVPSLAEFQARAADILSRLPADQLWINPDCGLKTRNWPEVRGALSNMVALARFLRDTVPETTKAAAAKVPVKAAAATGAVSATSTTRV